MDAKTNAKTNVKVKAKGGKSQVNRGDRNMMKLDSNSDGSDDEEGKNNCKLFLLLLLFTLANGALKRLGHLQGPKKKRMRRRSIEVRTDTSFETFKYLLAQNMDISVNRLNIGYTLSTWAAKEPTVVLSKVSHLVGLFEAVSKEMVRLDKAK